MSHKVDPLLRQAREDLRKCWLGHPAGNVALIQDDGRQRTYGELVDAADALASHIGTERSLVLIEATNSIETVVTYLACLLHGHAAMMLSTNERADADRIVALYRPNWIQSSLGGEITLKRAHSDTTAFGGDLALLLTTSGSTGSAKFVRLSAANLLANSSSIVRYLQLGQDERALANLPLHYSYGLSVLNSHLFAGAITLLTDRSVTDEGLWQFFTQHRGTSLAGVPHSYDLLDSSGFEERSLPTLRLLTQAGGRLPRAKVLRYSELARKRGWRFFVMYGQTEATARMAYLPHELSSAYPDCIGRAIPSGEFFLRRSDGSVIETNEEEGELVYRGPNVMLGYAQSAKDLASNDALEELVTGDMACRNAVGLYRVTGRKSRFLKLFGSRVGLDDLERRLEGAGFHAVCGGSDQRLVVLTTAFGTSGALKRFVLDVCKLPAHVVAVMEVSAYPTLASGKIDYPAIAKLGAAGTSDANATAAPHVRRVRDLYAEVFPAQTIAEDDTFSSLGGDSLTYVRVSLGLTDLVGSVPVGWEEAKVRDLEALVPQRGGRMAQVESVTVLRFLAMLSIVGTHFKLFSGLSGSPSLLMLLVGFNFARFQLPEVLRSNSVRPVLRGAWRIALPTLVVIGLLQWRYNDFSLVQLLLLGNWSEPDKFKFGFWFLELLVQMLLLLAVLLAVPSVRKLARNAPVAFGVVLLVLGVVAARAGMHLWSFEHLFNRVPLMFFWLFALGWMLRVLLVQSRRGWAFIVLVVSALAATVASDNLESTLTNPFIWVISGGAVLIASPRIGVPYPLDRAVSIVAGASHFIFLTHFPARNVGHRLGLPASPALDTVVGLIGGIAAWFVWERLLRLMVRFMRSWRPAMRLRRSRSND